MSCIMCGRAIPPSRWWLVRLMEGFESQKLCRKDEQDHCLTLFLTARFEEAGYTAEDLEIARNKLEGKDP